MLINAKEVEISVSHGPSKFFIKGSDNDFLPYVTKELASRPTRPTAAPPTAVTLQPRTSVKTLTMGEQKKIIPMLREPTHAAGDTERRKPE